MGGGAAFHPVRHGRKMDGQMRPVCCWRSRGLVYFKSFSEFSQTVYGKEHGGFTFHVCGGCFYLSGISFFLLQKERHKAGMIVMFLVVAVNMALAAFV